MALFKEQWLIPISMGGSAFLGVVLAIVHHRFYSSLNGRIVASQNQQEWNIRIGTGLAILIKMFLAASVGLTYTQVLWRTLKKQQVKVQGIDAMFSVVYNAFAFANGELWHKSFSLVVLAAIVWLVDLSVNLGFQRMC